MKALRLCAVFAAILLSSCATKPLGKTLGTNGPPRIGIIGFKVTADISRLSAIVERSPEHISAEEEKTLIDERLRHVEESADRFLVSKLNEGGKIVPVCIPEGFPGIKRGEKPDMETLEALKREYAVDAVMYGNVPYFGSANLLYPLLGETLDMTAETGLIGVLTNWNIPLIAGNIVYELATSTVFWFGGAFAFGSGFSPVTVEAHAVNIPSGTEIWSDSVDRFWSKKMLEEFPEAERNMKETQLEASMRDAIASLATELEE